MDTFRSAGREPRVGSGLGCVCAADSATDTRRQASRVTGARLGRRPMRRMDRFPRPIVRRRIRTRMRIKVRPNIPARANQDPNQGPPISQRRRHPRRAAGPGVGYGQPPRPAYQPGQNQSNGYQGPQGAASSSAALRPGHVVQRNVAGDSHQRAAGFEKSEAGRLLPGNGRPERVCRQCAGDSAWRCRSPAGSWT